jgi:hypothetical protein
MMKIQMKYPAPDAEKQMLTEFAKHAGTRYLYQKAPALKF